jgi:nitrite reductase/ring-hydroxylating ferredoxin subunit
MPTGALALLSALPDGEPRACEGVVDGDAEPLILLRDGDAVRAWLNICPHAGRRLDWAPGRFLQSNSGELVCAVHGATFEMLRGLCVAGPCVGASLRAVAVEVRDGAVWLA